MSLCLLVISLSLSLLLWIVLILCLCLIVFFHISLCPSVSACLFVSICRPYPSISLCGSTLLHGLVSIVRPLLLMSFSSYGAIPFIWAWRHKVSIVFFSFVLLSFSFVYEGSVCRISSLSRREFRNGDVGWDTERHIERETDRQTDAHGEIDIHCSYRDS